MEPKGITNKERGLPDKRRAEITALLKKRLSANSDPAAPSERVKKLTQLFQELDQDEKDALYKRLTDKQDELYAAFHNLHSRTRERLLLELKTPTYYVNAEDYSFEGDPDAISVKMPDRSTENRGKEDKYERAPDNNHLFPLKVTWSITMAKTPVKTGGPVDIAFEGKIEVEGDLFIDPKIKVRPTVDVSEKKLKAELEYKINDLSRFEAEFTDTSIAPKILLTPDKGLEIEFVTKFTWEDIYNSGGLGFEVNVKQTAFDIDMYPISPPILFTGTFKINFKIILKPDLKYAWARLLKYTNYIASAARATLAIPAVAGGGVVVVGAAAFAGLMYWSHMIYEKNKLWEATYTLAKGYCEWLAKLINGFERREALEYKDMFYGVDPQAEFEAYVKIYMEIERDDTKEKSRIQGILWKLGRSMAIQQFITQVKPEQYDALYDLHEKKFNGNKEENYLAITYYQIQEGSPIGINLFDLGSYKVYV